MPITDGGILPDEVLQAIYGALAGFNDMPVTVRDETRDEARGRYAQEIVRRGLVTPGCSCDVCEAIRLDAALMDA
jgi:hypothetical protein